MNIKISSPPPQHLVNICTFEISDGEPRYGPEPAPASPKNHTACKENSARFRLQRSAARPYLSLKLSAAISLIYFLRNLREKDTLGCTITPRGFPWREIFNFSAVTAGATLPSPLPIKRSFRNVVIRPRNVASHAGRPERTTRGAPATVPVRHREAL